MGYQLKRSSKAVPEVINVMGAPLSGKTTQGLRIARELKKEVIKGSPGHFTIYYDISEQEMQSRGADCSAINAHFKRPFSHFTVINACADPDTVFEQSKVVILGCDPCGAIISQLGFAIKKRAKAQINLVKEQIIQNFDTESVPKVKHDLYCMMQPPIYGQQQYQYFKTALSPGQIGY